MHEEYQYLLSHSLEEDAIDELNQMIDEEISRPMKKADISRIEQSIRAYMALMGNERELEELKKTGIEKLRAGQRVIHVKRRKRSLVVVAIAAILAIANAITVHASDENIVSFIIHYTENSFSVAPVQETRVITLPTTPDDPYGIKGYCAKYGLTVEAPTYIPEGFHLWGVEFDIGSSVRKDVSFWFTNGKVHLVFGYAEIYDWNARGGIPSDEFNLEEIEVNGKPAITSKEDGQYNLIYYDGNMEYFITSDSLSYAECNKIVDSIQ